MKRIKGLATGKPSQLIIVQNRYEKIRIGVDPKYDSEYDPEYNPEHDTEHELALEGRCLRGCGDIAVSDVWNQETHRFSKQDYPDNFDHPSERFAAVYPSF